MSSILPVQSLEESQVQPTAGGKNPDGSSALTSQSGEGGKPPLNPPKFTPKGVCFHCKKEGHWKKDCPNISKFKFTPKGACYHCKKEGHWKKDCPDIDKKWCKKCPTATDHWWHQCNEYVRIQQFIHCFGCFEKGHFRINCPYEQKIGTFGVATMVHQKCGVKIDGLEMLMQQLLEKGAAGIFRESTLIQMRKDLESLLESQKGLAAQKVAYEKKIEEETARMQQLAKDLEKSKEIVKAQQKELKAVCAHIEEDRSKTRNMHTLLDVMSKCVATQAKQSGINQADKKAPATYAEAVARSTVATAVTGTAVAAGAVNPVALPPSAATNAGHTPPNTSRGAKNTPRASGGKRPSSEGETEGVVMVEGETEESDNAGGTTGTTVTAEAEAAAAKKARPEVAGNATPPGAQ